MTRPLTPDLETACPAYGRGGLIAGVDEVGRGPLAGPVVAAAVILDFAAIPEGLTDSKKLSPAKRNRLDRAIRDKALVLSIASASVEEIDRLNILNATFLAMRRALEGLNPPAVHALIDGNRVPPGLPCAADAIIKGDGRSASIAAASIIAKVYRDRLMADLHRAFPAYGWNKNAGYGVAAHRDALHLVGPSPHHRKSFAPVAKALSEKRTATD